MLEFSLHTAWQELTAKYGTPLCGPPPREAGFAVIGYGKLAGLELGYGSDLDLVFLHDSSGAQQETNGSRRSTTSGSSAGSCSGSIHFLTIQTSSGRLYDVDTRLRPSGRAGLLVTSLDGFRDIRSRTRGSGSIRRCCAAARSPGRAGCATAFETLRRDVLVATSTAPSSGARSPRCAAGCATSSRSRSAAAST